MARNLYYEDEAIHEKFNLFMLKRLISYASSYRKKYIQVIALMLFAGLLSLLPASLNKVIIDQVLPQNGVVPDNMVSMSVCLLSIWLALSIGYAISNYGCNNVLNVLGNDVVCDLRKDLFSHLMKLSFDYYDNRPTGKILVRVTNYTDEIATFFINDMARVVNQIFMMVIALLCVCVIELRLAAAVVAVSIPLAAAVGLLSKMLGKRVHNDRNKYSNRTAFVSENITGLEVIKAFNREALQDEILEELNQKYWEAFIRTTHVREVFFPMTHGAVRIICTTVIYSTALFLIYHTNGKMSLGALVTVSTYMSIISTCMTTICQRVENIANMTSNIERVFDVMDTKPMITDQKDAVPMPDIRGNISFDHVTFSYQMGNIVLRDVSLSVKAGQMIALVGPTGAGKTTLVSLLDRFYDIQEGAIRIDGLDIRDVTLESLRRQIGVMMQDTYLFTDTIMENIRFARPDATDEECIQAAKKVYVDSFIRKLKDGYDTEISSVDTSLSGGQKQLLSFARLVLADPKIVILDEATSNVDTETEEMIQKTLKAVLQGRTSFVIAHRLSTIQSADRIIYIDNQSILEEGSHEELMNRKGHYYALIQQGKNMAGV